MAAPPRSVPWVIDEFMASRDMVECHNSCPITFTDCRPYRVLSGSAACSLACFSNWMKAHWANGWVNVIGNSGNRSLTASASLFSEPPRRAPFLPEWAFVSAAPALDFWFLSDFDPFRLQLLHCFPKTGTFWPFMAHAWPTAIAPLWLWRNGMEMEMC